MITGNTDVLSPLQKLNALMRVWAIADGVPQAPYPFHPSAALNIIEHSSESGQVGVNVTDDCITHLKTIPAFIGYDQSTFCGVGPILGLYPAESILAALAGG